MKESFTFLLLPQQHASICILVCSRGKRHRKEGNITCCEHWDSMFIMGATSSPPLVHWSRWGTIAALIASVASALYFLRLDDASTMEQPSVTAITARHFGRSVEGQVSRQEKSCQLICATSRQVYCLMNSRGSSSVGFMRTRKFLGLHLNNICISCFGNLLCTCPLVHSSVALETLFQLAKHTPRESCMSKKANMQ